MRCHASRPQGKAGAGLAMLQGHLLLRTCCKAQGHWPVAGCRYSCSLDHSGCTLVHGDMHDYLITSNMTTPLTRLVCASTFR
jgi:hypothetical protein